MPYGSTNGGSAPGGLTGGVPAKGVSGNKTLEKRKSISYNSTQSDMIFSISQAAAASSTNSIPKTVEVVNSGSIPIYVMVGYERYTGTSGGTPTGTEYLHVMLMPGEAYLPPVRAVMQTSADLEEAMVIGSSENNTEPSSINSGLLWKDILANLGADVDATTDPITITTASNHTNFFRVGDLIQIGRGTTQADLTESNHYREILRVQSITNTTTMVCERALYGTSVGDSDSANWNQGHANTFPIFLPFFNAYHDVDKYTVAQTDDAGKFKAYNFFTEGRTSSGECGITPGSVGIKFIEPGYQNLGLSAITSSTNSGLTAGETLKLDITVDGDAFADLTFTLDSSNVNFGGTNGVIAKIQAAFDAQYYTAGNLFEKKVTVGIVNGDIRFTSGQHLSTSAILLADTGDSDTFIDAAANGRIPASGDIPVPVAARFPDDTIYDPVTYAASHNTSAFCVDDGWGNLVGKCSGSINYETGAFNLMGAPANAEMAFSCNSNGAFSGAVNEAFTDRENTLKDVWVNTPNQHRTGSVKISSYE